MFKLLGNHQLPPKLSYAVSDVDRTLLPHDTESFHPELRDALKRSLPLSLCTGRTPAQSRKLLEDLPNRFHFLGGGGLLIHPDGRTEVQFPLTSEITNRIEEFASRMNVVSIHYLLEGASHWSSNRGTRGAPVSIVSLQTGSNFNDAEIVVRALNNEFPELYAAITFDVTDYFVHITYPEANKGYGIRFIVEKLNIPVSEIVSFGDSRNDIPMFESCSFNVAADDGVPELMELAHALCSPPEEDGFLEALTALQLIP